MQSRRKPRPAVPLGMIGVGLVLFASAVAASADAQRAAPPTGAVPYGVGETAEYQVKLGGIAVGAGVMEVLGIDVVNGRPSYRTRLHVRGGIPLARVDTRMESWIDTVGLFSRRFEHDQNELRFHRHRIFDFFPESRSYRLRGTGEVGSLPTSRPLDDLSFIYFARTLPLKTGDVYTIPRYFKREGNPVIIKVLRRDTVEVPAGRFETVVVQPIIKTDGLFGRGGEAELHFTDDHRRILVYLRSRVPIVGALSLNLRSYEAGE